jgi:hypothetical protein
MNETGSYQGETPPDAGLTHPLSMTGRLFAALAKARGEFPDIPKNRVARVKHEKGEYSYKYADLSDVFHAIDPILAAYGVTVIQHPAGQELQTIIAHESGDVVTGSWPIKPMKGQDLGNAQAYQAAVQVAKRYALTAMLGISTEETVEGGLRAPKRLPEPVNEDFTTSDGVRMPKGAKWRKGMTRREAAEEAARAISAQFKEPKTADGVSSVWDRNEEFIEMLSNKHDDLYQNILDEFHAIVESYGEPEGGETK